MNQNEFGILKKHIEWFLHEVLDIKPLNLLKALIIMRYTNIVSTLIRRAVFFLTLKMGIKTYAWCAGPKLSKSMSHIVWILMFVMFEGLINYIFLFFLLKENLINSFVVMMSSFSEINKYLCRFYGCDSQDKYNIMLILSGPYFFMTKRHIFAQIWIFNAVDYISYIKILNLEINNFECLKHIIYN